MSDQRGDNFTRMEDDGKLFPCLKCHAVIDATLDQVCDFLSDELHVKDYNDLVVSFRDLEDISPNSKICWGQSPQLFFVKPRDFVTFCSHRWKNDGTQVVVNQAVEHSDAPSDTVDGANGICRARALRGANCECCHLVLIETVTRYRRLAFSEANLLFSSKKANVVS